MKSTLLLSLFVLMTLACLVLGGIDSINLILKSVLYMVSMSVLMGIGVVYMAGRLEEETV